MGIIKQIKRDIRNFIKDVETELSKKWTIEYKGHTIEVINEMRKETLLIDGKIVSQNKKHLLSQLIKPYDKLSGTLIHHDGTKHKVTVKIGGFIKLNCKVKVDDETIFKKSLTIELLPWEHKEKIVPYILKQLETNNKVENALPDDCYVYDENHPPLAPGFADYVANELPTTFFAKKLFTLFENQVNNPNDNTRKATYEHIMLDQMASFGAQFIQLFKEAKLNKALVQQEAFWLLQNACHREVVKFAITVLGLTDCELYKEHLLKIGMHEEFTAYVISALKNGTKNANESVFRLAKSVHGWGKIVAVKNLEVTNSEIKQWILTKGCVNSIHNGYLAYTCAMKGKLDIELYEDNISKEIYDGARVIIEALLSKDAPHTIEDYPYAGSVLSRFVHHSKAHCTTIEDVHLLIKINEYISEDEKVWEKRFNNNWKPHEREAIKEMLLPLLDNPKWWQLAQNELRENSDYKTFKIANFYNLDVTTELCRLLEMEPANSEMYVAIMETGNEKYIMQLCAFAEKHFSFLNEQFDGQQCILHIVRSLHNYEGVGLSLIKRMLTSNSVGQYDALAVLDHWPKSLWTEPDIEEMLKKIEASTKQKENQELAKKLLLK